MSLQDRVENRLVHSESDVWMLDDHTEFAYTDGAESDAYLESVYSQVAELRAGSVELEQHIKDWPSEYHLSSKRAQLFDGFTFDRSMKALEVGCGCGAITRVLGEKFDDLISVEGSHSRARLARMRAKGLDSVSVLCAPFQQIRFVEKFDIIFCIGVYEYSASFVEGENPYEAVLAYFREILKPDGIVVIAIENQFGLKYFNTVREDHTGRQYDGLQGYAFETKGVQTFGKFELEENVRSYFPNISTYYPYPDYKMPTAIISDKFLRTREAGELVAQIAPRDYKENLPPLWDDSLVKLELARNGMLPFFADSLMVFASAGDLARIKFDQLAVISSSERIGQFRTVTRVWEDEGGRIRVSKRLRSGESSSFRGNVSLCETDSQWQAGNSIHTEVYRNCISDTRRLAEVFEPLTPWIEYLRSQSSDSGGRAMLAGSHIDSILSNSYTSGGAVTVIDREWEWSEKVPLNVVVIRGLFILLSSLEGTPQVGKSLRKRSYRSTIESVCELHDIQLTSKDFADFVALESEFQYSIGDVSRRKSMMTLKWSLANRQSYNAVKSSMAFGTKVCRKLKTIINRFRS